VTPQSPAPLQQADKEANGEADSFAAATLPHLDAAYSLARWIVRDPHVAQDMVQEAYLRALRYFRRYSPRYEGGDARPWLLQIVRNTCYTWLRETKRLGEHVEFCGDEDLQAVASGDSNSFGVDPQHALVRKVQQSEVLAAVAALPLAFREVIVLREIEELPYDAIAQLMDIPMGTVMSRLSRARALLRKALSATYEGVNKHG
jgi:RNA polymerase sigma factor (sigma-70 family)